MFAPFIMFNDEYDDYIDDDIEDDTDDDIEHNKHYRRKSYQRHYSTSYNQGKVCISEPNMGLNKNFIYCNIFTRAKVHPVPMQEDSVRPCVKAHGWDDESSSGLVQVQVQAQVQSRRSNLMIMLFLGIALSTLIYFTNPLRSLGSTSDFKYLNETGFPDSQFAANYSQVNLTTSSYSLRSAVPNNQSIYQETSLSQLVHAIITLTADEGLNLNTGIISEFYLSEAYLSESELYLTESYYSEGEDKSNEQRMKKLILENIQN